MGSVRSPVESPALRATTHTRRFASSRAILALILREMVTTYGRSPGGYIWVILEPVAGIGLLVVIFSLGFRNPPLGTDFAIFYATGLLPFTAYMSISSKATQALIFSRQLLVYPSVTLIDALFARCLLDFVTQLLVSFIVLAGILIFLETRTALVFSDVALAYTMLGALSFGVGTLNCFLASMFPIWARFWAVLNRPLLLVSGVIFIPESVPEPYRSYLLYNPLVHITGQMRRAFYPYYDAVYVSPAYVFGLSLVLTAGGLLFLRRYTQDILEG